MTTTDAPFRLHLEADPADYLEVKVDWAAGCDRAMYTCACGLVFEDVAELVAHLYAHNARRVFVNPAPIGNNGHGIPPFAEAPMTPEKPEQLPAEPTDPPRPTNPIAEPDRDRPDRPGQAPPDRPGRPDDRPLPRPKS